MIINVNDHLDKVRVLKKVRRQFLHRTPDDEDEERERERAVLTLSVNPDTHYLASGCGYPIKASFAIFEVQRKLCIGPEYLNLYFNIQRAVVENVCQNKAITLIFSLNENKPIIPWEYTTKRLESYGDLDLAMWAQRIKEHYLNYNRAVATIRNQVVSDDPETQTWLRKLKVRSALARREIESKCAYARCDLFFRIDSSQTLSYTFSEKFLEKLGFPSPESFIKWSKDNGVPKILAGIDVYEGIVKEVLTGMPKLSEAIIESPVSTNLIYTQDGSKVIASVKYVIILDPTPEGTFYYCYIIFCDTEDTALQTKLSLENKDPGSEIPKKKIICTADEDDDDDEDKENYRGQ